jgi:hypothetical protein
MVKFKRNVDKETNADVLKLNILAGLVLGQFTDSSRGVSKSELGYMAFPDYNFAWPQGAAFAVAKIARQLSDAGLIRNYPSYKWYVTKEGIAALQPLYAALVNADLKEKAQAV